MEQFIFEYSSVVLTLFYEIVYTIENSVSKLAFVLFVKH